MADLTPASWNTMVRHVSDRLVGVINSLVDQTMASGYPPFTAPPSPDIRFLLYTIRPIEEWRLMTRSDPDDLKDFSNIARRRNQSEAALEAARAVLSELALQGVPTG